MPAIALPAIGFTPTFPRLVRNESLDRVGERAVASIEWADPSWAVQLETVPLRAEEQLLLEAFREQATALQSVLFIPVHNWLPQAYWKNPTAAAVNDTGTLTSVTNGKTVAIGSVTNGLSLKRGDLFSLATGDYRSLHRVMADAVAASASITLSVEPAVPPYITTSALARWRKPELNMRVVPGSFELDDGRLPAARWQMTEVPR